MIKLRKIIEHLDNEIFTGIENTLVKNKSDNFLYLLKSYRTNVNDSQIITSLNLTSNSFYVLKSRLFDKVQEQLSGNIHVCKEELLRKMNQIPEMCFSESNEISEAFLQKLEKDLLMYDMHSELLIVYSALKRTNVYSDRYYLYSQLYNKHIAFSLSLEKSEEILGNFNRILSQYNFSKSAKLLETLLFIRKEIADHSALNKSRQIEIIKNFIELQLCIFCNTEIGKEINIEELLNQTNKLINELPGSSFHKNWALPLDYLYFEYYFKIKQFKYALSYYEKVNSNLHNLFLYTNICLTSKFLISKLAFLQERGMTQDILAIETKALIFNSHDTHTKVILGIYSAMVKYHSGNCKEAAAILNKIINENSFKDYFHINTEVKLTLAFIYITVKEYDMAENITKSIYRKITTEKINNYVNVLDLIRVFDADIKQNNKKTAKQKDDFTLFTARNINESELLTYLQFELRKRYN